MAMLHEEFIELILDSYELKEERKQKLKLLFNRISPKYETEADFYRIATEIISKYTITKDALSPLRYFSLNKDLTSKEPSQLELLLNTNNQEIKKEPNLTPLILNRLLSGENIEELFSEYKNHFKDCKKSVCFS